MPSHWNVVCRRSTVLGCNLRLCRLEDNSSSRLSVRWLRPQGKLWGSDRHILLLYSFWKHLPYNVIFHFPENIPFLLFMFLLNFKGANKIDSSILWKKIFAGKSMATDKSTITDKPCITSVSIWTIHIIIYVSIALSCRSFSHVNQLTRLDQPPRVAPATLIMKGQAARVATHYHPAFPFVFFVEGDFALALRTIQGLSSFKKTTSAL